MIFRITKGATFTIIKKITYEKDKNGDPVMAFIDPKDGSLLNKAVFLIMYSSKSELLSTRLNRLCDAFEASKFPIPKDYRSFLKRNKAIDQ
jgi:hypothetical protein